MKNSDKLKLNRKELFTFFIPFVILSLVVGGIRYKTAQRRVNDINVLFERSTIDIANSYAQIIMNSQEMNSSINELMEEKIIATARSVLLLDEEEITNNQLSEIAKKLNVWRINIYNKNGVVIASNAVNNVGWKSYQGHPVEEFRLNGEEQYIEEIREATISKDYLKFGYIRTENGNFIQVGIEANDYQKFTRNFQAQNLIDSIKERDNITHVLLIDMNSRIIASSMGDEPGTLVKSKGITKHINDNNPGMEKYKSHGKNSIHTYAPIYIRDEKIGNLSIIWDSHMIDLSIREIFYNSIREILIIIIILASILFYAFKKNKSNIKIAYYDKLTGLPNKEYLEEYIEEFIEGKEEVNKAILLINLKNFKLVNTTYGYKYGDQILVQSARNIKGLEIPQSKLFRFNADRFIMLVEDYKNIKELRNIASTINESFAGGLCDKHRLEYLGFEIVIMELSKYNSSLDDILQNISYTLANTGYLKDNIMFYNDIEEEKRVKDNKIEKVLEKIINKENKKSLYLEFQPKLDMKTNKIIGFEALSRIEHKELGFISPMEFIKIAEERMLIYDLGIIILEKSCEFLSFLSSSGFDGISVSVNVSAVQILRDEFVDDLERIAKEKQVDMSLLELEITESILIDNFDLVNQKLKQIKKLGMSISIDDFGTGFSSFYRLQNLNVDILKIDKCFIDNILLEDENKLISRDIISMALRLGLTVVAEGVEREEQRYYLEKYNCHIIQGYLISKPLNKEASLEILQNYR